VILIVKAHGFSYALGQVEAHMMMDNRQQAYTTRSAAVLLDMSQDGLRHRIRTGQVKAVLIGKHYFVPAEEIDRLLRTEHSAE
jgi:Helix-turn-helix domain